MFPNESQSDEARRFLIFFFLKVNLIIIALFFFLDSLIREEILLLAIALILFVVGGLLVYRDIRNDPYQILRLFMIQTLLWWRLRGPLIARKPFFYHFPEGGQLIQHYLVRTISVQQKDLTQGANLLVRVKAVQICPECNGKRSKPMTVQIECNHCRNGRQFYPLAAMSIPMPCKHCLGVGWIPVHPCHNCQGKGSVWYNQKIRVQIPPYTTVGTKLRIPNYGKVDPKTLQQGDLFLKLRKKILDLI